MGGHGGSGSLGSHGGIRSSGGHGGIRSSGGYGGTTSEATAPGSTAGAILPPQKKSLGEIEADLGWRSGGAGTAWRFRGAGTGACSGLESAAGLPQGLPAGESEPRTAVLSSPWTAGLLWPRMAAALTSPRTAGLRELRTAAGLGEPRMATLSSPRTAALISPRTTGLREPRTMAGWFWLGAGHSPDTGESLPSILVLWCLGGPRGDGSWPRARTAREWWCHRVLSPWFPCRGRKRGKQKTFKK